LNYQKSLKPQLTDLRLMQGAIFSNNLNGVKISNNGKDKKGQIFMIFIWGVEFSKYHLSNHIIVSAFAHTYVIKCVFLQIEQQLKFKNIAFSSFLSLSLSCK
jgi:NADH:ubiquinone oxidoreductase subunit K